MNKTKQKKWHPHQPQLYFVFCANYQMLACQHAKLRLWHGKHYTCLTSKHCPGDYVSMLKLAFSSSTASHGQLLWL